MFHDNLEEDKRAGLETLTLLTHSHTTATNFVIMKFILLPQTLLGIRIPFSRLHFLRQSESRWTENAKQKISASAVNVSISGERRKLKSSIEEFKKKTLTALKSRSEFISPQIPGVVGRKEIVKPIKYVAKENSQMGTPCALDNASLSSLKNDAHEFSAH